MSKILVIGSASIDLILKMQKLPAAGEMLADSSPYGMTPGGKGSDLALALSMLDAETVFCTRLGADSHGQRLLTLYRNRNMDTRYIGIDKTHNTGFSVTIAENGTLPRTVYYPGAGITVSRGDMEKAFDCAPDGLLLAADLPFDSTVTAARMAYERDIPVFFQCAPISEHTPLESLPPLEILTLSAESAFRLTGYRAAEPNDCLRIGIALLRRVKYKNFVLRLGARGAFVYDGKYCHMSAAFPVRKIVDKTGASDAFAAALTASYLESGKNILAACESANAAGALSIQKVGASTSFPNRAEIAEYIRNAQN